MMPTKQLKLHSIEAERAILGSLILDSEAIVRVSHFLSPDDFHIRKNRWIYRTILKLRRQGQRIDHVTLCDELERQDLLEEIGGAAYVSGLQAGDFNALNVESYAQIVKGWAIRRQAESVMSNLGANLSGDGAFDDALLQAIEDLNTLRMDRLGPVEHRSLDEIRDFFGDINWAWRGWIPVGHLTMIAGEQAVGKSYLAARLAASFTGHAGQWPDGLQFEEFDGWARKKLPGRVLLVETEEMRGVYAERLERMDVSDPWVIFGPGGETHLPNLLEEADAIERLAHDEDCCAIIIDSLSGGHGLKERTEEMRELLKCYSGMAARLQIPIIVVHHARKKREFESAQVTLDRVRGSTTITQFCRSVLGLYRLDDAGPMAPVRVEPVKSTFCKPQEAIGFTITDGGLVFGEAPEPVRPESQQDKAADLLLTMLAEGPMPSTELYDEAEGAGISKRTLKIAKKNIGIVAKRVGGSGGHWVWALPSKQEEQLPL